MLLRGGRLGAELWLLLPCNGGDTDSVFISPPIIIDCADEGVEIDWGEQDAVGIVPTMGRGCSISVAIMLSGGICGGQEELIREAVYDTSVLQGR